MAVDRKMLEIIKRGLQNHVGKANAITNKEIQARLLERHRITISGPEIRDIMHQIRCEEGLIVCGDGKGYYLEANLLESQKAIASMKGRAEKILKAATAMEKTQERKYVQYNLFNR